MMYPNKIKKFTLAIFSLIVVGVAHAAYPEQAITITVPFSAGGPTDLLARQLALSMQKILKQSVNLEYISGAGGTIGTTKIARANPDGYSLLFTHIGIATAPALYKHLPFDPTRDFEYIGRVIDVPMVFVTRPGLPVKNFQELISYTKNPQNNTTLANAGAGSASHLCGLLFQSALQTNLNTIHYKGTGPALLDLVADRVDLICDQSANIVSPLQSSKIKAFAVAGNKKIAIWPNLPLASDTKNLKDFNVRVWYGLYAPKGTSKEVLEILGNTLRIAVADPDFTRRILELGAEPVSPSEATAEALRNLLLSEIAKWAPLIRAAGVYAE